MKNRAATLTLLIATVLCIARAAASEPQLAAPLAKLELNDGDTIVFLGDSITHQCLYTQYVEDFFYTRFPGKRLVFHNAGVGGAKAWDALERFDRDVAAYKPKYVTVLLGMNDGSYQPFNQQVFDTYQQDMTALIGRIKEAGATPILMTPTMFDSRAARLREQRRPRPEGALELYNSVLAYYGTWLREVAAEKGYGFVDMWSPLNNLTLDERKTNPAFTMIRDAVHPDPPGQLVMAFAIIDGLGLRGPVSNIRLVRTDRGQPQARAAGGKLSEVEWAEEGMAFTWRADALPWVVPAEAQVGAKLLRLGHRASAERLEVHGLPAGQYELTIDDKSVGVFAATDLARHVELQENAATPQHQQALRVAELNAKRNAGPVRSLRNAWGVFQQISRLRKPAQERPDDEQLRDQLAALEQQRLAGLEDRITEHERAAKAIEDEIFHANQPQPRRYELKRVRLAPVEGTVTINGRPLVNATVTFFDGGGRRGEALTDANGRYRLRTAAAAGVIPGQYRVTVSAAGVPPRFADADATQLQVDVVPDRNEINFDLKAR